MMSLASLGASHRIGAGRFSDPFETFFGGTTASGTILISSAYLYQPPPGQVNISVDALLEYERTILRLRQEILHYKKLLAHFLAPRDPPEEIKAAPALDSSSILLIDSIISAQVPASATFPEPEGGDL